MIWYMIYDSSIWWYDTWYIIQKTWQHDTWYLSSMTIPGKCEQSWVFANAGCLPPECKADPGTQGAQEEFWHSSLQRTG